MAQPLPAPGRVCAALVRHTLCLESEMKIEIKNNTGNIDWNKISALFESIGWGKRDPGKIKKAFNSSEIVVFVLSNSDVIGIGRVLTDFEFYATIFDVIVAPEY